MTRTIKANPKVVTPDSPTNFRRGKSSDAAPGNLPASFAPLLGREQEIAALRQLLARDGVHLVTITGPGGVGKTSLALRVAHEAQDLFVDGVFFVSLAPIGDPTLIVPTIAQTLNLPESPRRLWLDTLKDYLHDRHVMLLLDNFEQIISAAPLLTELLSACPGLRLLVTSREALRVRGEQEFALLPLAVPDQLVIETLPHYPSIALIASARRAHARYFLSFEEDAEKKLTGADQKAWLVRLDREQDNLRAALLWALENRDGELAQRMAGALQPFWFRRGHWSEGRRWLEDSLAIESSSTLNQAIRASALYGACMLARFQGDFARARMLCEQSLEIYRTLADQTGVLKTLAQICRITSFQADQKARNAFLAYGAYLIETLPDSVVKGEAYTDMALAMLDVNTLKFHPSVPGARQAQSKVPNSA